MGQQCSLQKVWKILLSISKINWIFLNLNFTKNISLGYHFFYCWRFLISLILCPIFVSQFKYMHKIKRFPFINVDSFCQKSNWSLEIPQSNWRLCALHFDLNRSLEMLWKCIIHFQSIEEKILAHYRVSKRYLLF